MKALLILIGIFGGIFIIFSLVISWIAKSYNDYNDEIEAEYKRMEQLRKDEENEILGI